MKFTHSFMALVCSLLIIASCKKEYQSPLSIDVSEKANKHQGTFKAKDFRLKKIKNTIWYSPSLTTIPVEEYYELIYNNKGDIERINFTSIFDDLIWETNYQAYFKGAHLDSISRYSLSGSGPFFSGFKYKGNNLVEVLFYSGYMEPEKRIFEYDKKGRLLNGLQGMRFIYDDDGYLVKFVYPVEYFNASFNYERTSNPMFINDLHLFLTYGNLNELCYSQWNITSKVESEQTIRHLNSYDELGRLKTKRYSQGGTSYLVEFSY